MAPQDSSRDLRRHDNQILSFRITSLDTDTRSIDKDKTGFQLNCESLSHDQLKMFNMLHKISIIVILPLGPRHIIGLTKVLSVLFTFFCSTFWFYNKRGLINHMFTAIVDDIRPSSGQMVDAFPIEGLGFRDEVINGANFHGLPWKSASDRRSFSQPGDFSANEMGGSQKARQGPGSTVGDRALPSRTPVACSSI